jgi:translocation and assembly module TamB
MNFRRKRIWVVMAITALPLLAIAIAWTQRAPIAKSYIDKELAKRGVQATYDIREIGTKRQRIENIIIGDPARPDLTADWAEIDTSLRFFGADVKDVRASGVRLRGTLKDGILNLGTLDKLLPKPTGEPFTFPDVNLDMRDTQLALATPWGNIGAAFSGQGNLAQAFKAKGAIASHLIQKSGMVAKEMRSPLSLTIKDQQIGIDGPLSLASLSGAGVALGKTRAELAASVDTRSWNWSMTAQGDSAVAALPAGMARVARFDVRARQSQSGLATDGSVRLDSVRATPAEMRQLARFSDGAGTPAESIIAKFKQAIAGLDRGSTALVGFSCGEAVGGLTCSITPDEINSASGLRIRGSGQGFSVRGDGTNLAHHGDYAIAGGGFPAATVHLDLVKGVWTGTAAVQPYQAGTSKIALAPITLHYDRAGLRVNSAATLDGPIGTGRVVGLKIPLVLKPGVAPLSGCIVPQFKSIELAGLTLAQGVIKTCLAAGEARIESPQLTGRLGKTPIKLSAATARFGTARGDFSVNGLAVSVMNGTEPSVLTVGQMSGSIAKGGASGRYAGLAGKIGAVPLLLSEGAGTWDFARGVFATKASVRIADAVPAYRFNPLISNDFSLRLVDGQITASGVVRAPKSGIAISDVAITHSLSNGIGRAILSVPNLTFGQALQPEELTPITLGVIANVAGSLNGRGEIDWSPKGVTSRGTFRTSAMDMAAAFGPVAGLSGEINLSDLLALETAPGQSISIAAINPGIAVLNGQIRYQLLPGLKAGIEGGRWPFAGGMLILEPTVLDLSEKAQRRFTFRVEGLDMSRFIAAMEFENIAATGIFDGTLPMIFDQEGGRIVGGQLVARGGGTLSYVGEISNENIGAMGRFAFDALKSIKYDRLSIDLEGAIDGDVITRIKFAGVNQAPITGMRSKLPIPVKITGLTNIPFIFNVTITAKFRQLFEMARSFNDPSVLINRMLPQLEPVPKDERKPVQPPESTPKP